MAVEEKEVSALRRLGLTEYESRIYLALIKMGPKKASEVSFFAQVPRTKAYGAIRELKRKGLLEIVPGKPELYVPSSPNEFLMPLVTKLNGEVKDSESAVHELALLYESSKYIKREMPKEIGEFWQIDGRQNISNKLNELFNGATRSINYSTTASGLIRAYKIHSEMLEKATKRGAVVRVLSQISSENSALAQELSELVELKRLDNPFGASFASVDRRELMVIECKPDDLRTDRGSDIATWTTRKLLVELHDDLFERIWNALPTAKLPVRRN